ncbi:MAG: FtsW/RodA/SpoVE family cell cycle protein [Lawsonibacter sp.]
MARKPKRDLTVEEQLARGPLDLPFLMLVLLLLGIGLIMMFSASYATAYYTDGDPLVYISRQALFGAVGVVGMFVVSKINYQTFRWMSMPALIGSIVLLVLVFTPLGVTHNQARRWLKLGIEFQPSEFAKIAVILFFAARLSKRDTEKRKRYKNRTFTGRMLNRLERVGFLELVPYGAILLLVAALMLKQPHMSGTILVLAGGRRCCLPPGSTGAGSWPGSPVWAACCGSSSP